MLGIKQKSKQNDWINAIKSIKNGGYDWRHLDTLIDKTLCEIQSVTNGKNVAFAWSGGKDSLALELVLKNTNIKECVMAICNLEYPIFLQWVTSNMPNGLELINTGQDLEWLSKNQDMLFPVNSNIAAKWFKIVQHKGQEQYYKRYNLDMIILGRRKQDGNYVGSNNIYTNAKDITRYSPLAEWKHEDVLAIIERYGGKYPPIYSFPRGFQCGTHPWAARQWCDGKGWNEIYSIDKNLVIEASNYISSAKEFLQRS